MPVRRLSDNSDSISGQRRRHKYQRPTERERRAIIDAHLAGDEWKRDFKTIEGRHGQSSTAINAPAHSDLKRPDMWPILITGKPLNLHISVVLVSIESVSSGHLVVKNNLT